MVLDTHQYLMIAEAFGCEQTLEGYINYIKDVYEKDIAEVQEYVPVVCGEWCIFNSLAVGMDTKGGQSSLNGVDFSDSKTVSEEEKRRPSTRPSRKRIWTPGPRAAATSTGPTRCCWIPPTRPNWRGWDCWDLAKSVDLGWFPEKV